MKNFNPSTYAYSVLLPFHSFHLGLFLGLLVFSVKENLYPVTAMGVFGIMLSTSYLSILFWEEAQKSNG